MIRDPREAIAPLLAFTSTLRATSKPSRSYASSPKTGYPLRAGRMTSWRPWQQPLSLRRANCRAIGSAPRA